MADETSTNFKFNLGDIVKRKRTREQPYCVMRRTVKQVDGKPRNFYTLQREDDYDNMLDEYNQYEVEERNLELMADKGVFADAVEHVSQIMASCGVTDIKAFDGLYRAQLHARMKKGLMEAKTYVKL